MGELRLVGEYGGNRLSEFVTDLVEVCFIGYFNEFIYCFFVEGVNVGLIVVPGAGVGSFDVGIPLCALRFFGFTYAAVAFKIAVFVEHYVVGGDEFAVSRADGAGRGVEAAF